MDHADKLSDVFEMLVERLGRVEDVLQRLDTNDFLTPTANRWVSWLTALGFQCRRASRAQLATMPSHVTNRCFVVVNHVDLEELLVVVRDDGEISYEGQSAFAEHLIESGARVPFLVVDRPLFPCNRIQIDEFEGADSGWKEYYNNSWGSAMNGLDAEGCVIGTLAHVDFDSDGERLSAVQLVQLFGGSHAPVFNASKEEYAAYKRDMAVEPARLKYMFRWFHKGYWICTKVNETGESKPDPGWHVVVPSDKFESLEMKWTRLRPPSQ